MRSWQYTTTKGGLENNLKLNPTPLPQPKPTQHLVQMLAVALNPVDYKPAEIAIFSRLAIPKPATPGIDFVGRIVTPAAGSTFKPGQLVFGVAGTSPFAAGALREYAVTEQKGTVAVPEGLEARDAATIGVAGLTAYQSLLPYVKKGDRVFINGGSGGTGAFGIQIAKAKGCHVTTTCSTANVQLCESLGADAVIDYKQQGVLAALKANGQVYDHVVDNVGHDTSLYWKCHEYTTSGAKYVAVGADPSLGMVWNMLKITLWPGFLGGAKRKYQSIFAQTRNDELTQVAAWMREGKVKAVVDQVFGFEEAPEAVRKLKTGRAKGKIVVDVVGKGKGLA